MFNAELLQSIRDRFAHVDVCPYQGERVYFENAGGSLCLKTVVEVSAALSAIPDNHGRDNPASQALMQIIVDGKKDMMLFMGAEEGMVFVGETGSECLFRLIRAAALSAPEGGNIVGSTYEHPSTMSAGKRWAAVTDRDYRAVAHNSETGELSAGDYAAQLTPDTRIAIINHTNPVTGIAVDVVSISAAVRSVSPECFIIVDGIQHAPHGAIEVDKYGVDAYVVSGYKMYSKPNFGVAWISPRLSSLPHDKLDGMPIEQWELGTRDTSVYAAFSEVVNYLQWLGAQFTKSQDRRVCLLAAGTAMAEQERSLLKCMMQGCKGQAGLDQMPQVVMLISAHCLQREGVVAMYVEGMDSEQVVQELSERGIRVHIRINDHYSGAVLAPLNLEHCVRVSMSHYNSEAEVLRFLKAMQKIIALPA